MPRKYTDLLLEMIDNGELDQITVIFACLNYMSESDVKDMMWINDFVPLDDEADEADEDL